MRPLCLMLVLLSGDLILRTSAASELSRVIDEHLAQSHHEHGVVAAPLADDAEFLRRASLDLIGRIPTSEEVRTFLGDSHPEKRTSLIDRLLASEEHAQHFSRTWRGLLLPEANTERQLQYLVPGFEAWLRQRRAEGAGFDQIVRELLTAPITESADRPQMVLTDLRAANPLAFMASKEADPAKLAGAATRLFLGIRLECAECHNHPFDQWSQTQFWNQAAFFAGIQRRGRGAFAPLYEDASRRTIPLMNSTETAPVLFLDGSEPVAAPGQSARVALAEWITSPENPYFAQAIANRIWGQLMGTGIVTPVDDMHASNSPSHPELLYVLATSFAESQFDLSVLIRAICTSDAYQRTSRITHESQQDRSSFAAMPVKPLNGEQFFDSLALAVGYQPPATGTAVGRGQDPARRRFVELFPDHDIGDDPSTSVAQALALMNGGFVDQAVTPETSRLLGRLTSNTELSTSERIDELYLSTVSRHASPDEMARLEQYITADEADQGRALGDILWMLLNTAEFRWNH
ncbi:MAG: DUF1553 domain-containing protein [Planctomycetaceae bacterium]|nr:DUF1553 domain-containing protein [Planctomycetaceae bacterium]